MMSKSFALVLSFAALCLAGFGVGRILIDEEEGPASESRAARRNPGVELLPSIGDPESRPESRPESGPSESVAPEPGSIFGRVVDRGGIPINHAEVIATLRTPPGERNFALVSEFRHREKVDAEGRFRFMVPGGGVYRLAAEAEGFAQSHKDGIKPGAEVELIVEVGAALEVVTVDVTTAKPVKDVLITLRAGKGSLVRREKTDAEGTARFKDLPDGAATLSAEHDEYVHRQNIERALGSGDSEAMTIELDPGKSIKGLVQSAEEQRPVGGAEIVVGKKKTKTDEGGRFLLKGLAAESHDVRTIAEGFMANERTLSLAGSRREAEAEIFLDRGASVRGRVVSDQGEPVVGAEIKLFESWGGGRNSEESHMWEDWSTRHLVSKTDEAGVFKLAGIAPQGWSQRSLRARHADFADAFERGLKLTKKEDELSVVLTMRPGGSISGKVVDTDNRPVSGARVELRPKNFWENSESEELDEDGSPQWREKNLKVTGTDGEGAFSFPQLSEGSFQLRIEAKGWSTASQNDLKLSRGQRLDTLHFTLERGEPLKGYVIDPLDTPIAGARIHVSTKNGSAEVVSDAKGEFQIETIPKGPYSVSATAAGYAAVRLQNQMPDMDRGIRIVVKKQGTIVGKVIDVATKKPLKGASIELQKEEPRWGNSMRTWSWFESDKEGGFRLQGDDGAYRVLCNLQGYVRFRRDDVRVDSNATETEPLVIEMKRGGAIEGIVRGADGRPDAGTSVYVRKDSFDGRFLQSGNSETDGYFYCGDLDAGTYDLVAQRPGFPLVIVRGVHVGGDKPAQADIQLRTETTLTLGLTWADPPAPPVDPGEIAVSAATPAPNVRPRQRPRPNLWIESLEESALQLDWSNENGEEGFTLGRRRWIWMGQGNMRQTLRDLPPGRYRIRCEAKGHEPFVRVVNLIGGGGARVDVVMHPTPGAAPYTGPQLRRMVYMDEEGNQHVHWHEDG